MTFPFPFFIPAGVRPIDISHVASAVDAANATNYTFSSVAFGAAHAGRWIAVAVVSRSASSAPITGVTIGGVAATDVFTPGNISDTHGAVFVAPVPTGTSGDVVVSHSAGNVRCAISVYRLIGADALNGTGGFNADTNPGATINVAKGGAAIAISLTSANTTATWTGLDEDADATVESGNTFSAAHRGFADAAPSHSIQCTWGSNSNIGFAYAVFAPG